MQCNQHQCDYVRPGSDWAEGTKQARRNANEWQRRAREAMANGHADLAGRLWAQAGVEMREREYTGAL